MVNNCHCEEGPRAKRGGLTKQSLMRLLRSRWSLAMTSLAIFFVVDFAFSDEEQFIYDSNHRRDPFSPLVSSSGEMLQASPSVLSAENISLEGIIWDPKGVSVAIINGTIVKEGDMVDTIAIKKIADNYVVVLIGDAEKIIPLIKEGGGEDVKEDKNIE